MLKKNCRNPERSIEERRRERREVKSRACRLFTQGVNSELICKSLEISRAGLYRARLHGPRKKPSIAAVNALSEAEVTQVLDTLHSEEFIEDTPY